MELTQDSSFSIFATPLSSEAFSPFGQVIEASSPTSITANQGTAQRFDWLATVENLRTSAKMNICAFRCQPREIPFVVRLLERHPFSTQMFSPMTVKQHFLVIVSEGKESPDIRTIRAFVARKNQAICYHPGVWHHPLIALDTETEFTCIVYEDQTEGDCQIFSLPSPVTVLMDPVR